VTNAARALRHLAALAAFGLLAAGCAHYPPTAKLDRWDPRAGYRFEALPAGDNSDSLFICLAFSGGGTRAAALAYGALAKLAAIRITWEGRSVRLLDEVDCISSVSGGSFTAAYYALRGDALFQDFGGRFLYRDIQGELAAQLLNPVNLARLASPWFSRIDLAAELYDETVFDRRTFGDLLARRRPFVILNATHMQLGERFEFTQDRFDFLGSDLGPFPLGRAAAASSAFPILLSPITLTNHPDAPGFTPPEAVAVARDAYYANTRRWTWARHLLAYGDKAAHPWVHLMDGGLADNIGLRAIADEYRRGFIRDRLAGRIKKLVIVAVNARTAARQDLDRKERPPGLVDVAYKTATISMDNYSFESVEIMRELAEEREKAQRAVRDCQAQLDARCPGRPPLTPLAGGDLKSYVIEINFDGIADPGERDCFLGLPTTFALPRGQVDALVDIAGALLEAHPVFQALLRDLGIDPASVPSRPPARCRD
jgi:predicted acylesterase/phospholipase RssA